VDYFPRIGASNGVAIAGSASFSTLSGSGSCAAAYRSGIAVLAAIIIAAQTLALIDRHRARLPAAAEPA
jgi:hypothetical protein